MKLIHIEEPKHTEKVALKKAKMILVIRPDIILFEFPKQTNKKQNYSYANRFQPQNKPKKIINQWKATLTMSSERYPWLRSEHKIIEAIEKLWIEGKQVYLFEIDAPVELTGAVQTKGMLGSVWYYLRDSYMVDNIRKIEKTQSKNKVALVFCHDYHWKNIEFLLKRPSKKEIWHRYFTKYGTTESPDEIMFELKKHNKILYKYWKLKKFFLAGIQ